MRSPSDSAHMDRSASTPETLGAPQKKYLGHHAIVIGASIGGLLAARVLSDRFERVTVVERDYLAGNTDPRPGVPQGGHLHVLLSSGEHVLLELFSGLSTELLHAGAVPLDLPDEVLWYQDGGYKVRFQSSIVLLFMSRPLLEESIRRRVLALPNVTCIDSAEVCSLVGNKYDRRVTGVTLRRRAEGSSVETLAADFVVDATGRNSRSPHWLEALGYSKPRETAIKVDICYTTRIYQEHSPSLPNARGIFIAPSPPEGKRAGALFPIEGGRWIVTLVGWLGDRPPVEEDGFLEYAKTLPAPDLHDAICRATPLGDFATHTLPTSLRRHYDEMPRFPEGYLVMGDAFCSFNPFYGQGMSVCALEARALADCLQEADDGQYLSGLARNFFGRVARIVATPWKMTAVEDFRFPSVEGVKPVGTAALSQYLTLLHRASLQDSEVARAFYHVMMLTHPPETLLGPRVALGTLSQIGLSTARQG